jgi:hypothetical protein
VVGRRGPGRHDDANDDVDDDHDDDDDDDDDDEKPHHSRSRQMALGFVIGPCPEGVPDRGWEAMVEDPHGHHDEDDDE